MKALTTAGVLASLALLAIPASASSATPAQTPSGEVQVRTGADLLRTQEVRDPSSQRGIIKLGNCSASLVAFETTQLTGKAMMLTNGHCMSGASFFPSYGEIYVDTPSRLKGALLDTDSSEVMKLSASEVVYGTMTYTDAAIIDLDQTYEQIKQQTGIDPLVIASRSPKPGDKLTVNSGYWKTTYSCPMTKQVYRLIEGQWMWKDAVKYQDNCGTKGGTSGSPVIDDATGEVVAVNNTGSEDGGRCTTMNPCEVDENNNVYYKKGTAYGTQTEWFTSCLDDVGRLDLDVAGCRLLKPGEKPEDLQLPDRDSGNPPRVPAPEPEPAPEPAPEPEPEPELSPLLPWFPGDEPGQGWAQGRFAWH